MGFYGISVRSPSWPQNQMVICSVDRNSPSGVVISTAALSSPWRSPEATVCLVVRNASQWLAEGSAVRAPASSFPWRPPRALILPRGPEFLQRKRRLPPSLRLELRTRMQQHTRHRASTSLLRMDLLTRCRCKLCRLLCIKSGLADSGVG